MKDGEKGFLLLETLVLAAVLVLMASALLLYRQGLRMEAQTRFEAAATFLAESEFAYLEYRAASGTLAEGASVRQEQAGAYRAAVTVAWQHGGRQHQQVYQRRVGVYEGQ